MDPILDSNKNSERSTFNQMNTCTCKHGDNSEDCSVHGRLCKMMESAKSAIEMLKNSDDANAIVTGT